jgi:hypothetical protein
VAARGAGIIAIEELKVRQKIEDMMVYAYQALNQYPKSEKHCLVAETKASMFQLLELVIICNKKYYKKNTLQELDVELDVLRSYVRLGFNLYYLPPKKYEIWSKLNDEIGRMIGGWIKSQNGFAKQ